MKIQIKKISIFVFLCAILFSFSFSDTADNLLKIQLRINNGEKVGNFPYGLKLFINKEEVEITGLEKRERFIEKERLLGRNFVLTFMNFDMVDKSLENAISYFVTEILDKTDTLVIQTHVNIYAIKVTENKERMILDITNRLKNDFNFLLSKSARIVKNINSEIAKLERFFSSYSPSTGYVLGGARFFQFFTTLIPDIQFYKNEFVIPDKNKFEKIHDQFGFREGDRYWIFFRMVIYIHLPAE